MPDNFANGKRIAKNTLLLYVRMLFLMLVSLYTSRLILNALGVEDYGIYNVVGGIVTLFAFLNGALTSSSLRFITYYLGKGDLQVLQRVFSNCVFIHGLIAIIVVVLSETVGLWFLYNKMVISEERMEAAFWVFQMSVITTVILILSTPYNAAIIAYERMSAFAYIAIVEALFKLLAVLCLFFSKWDNLVLYSILMVTSQFIVRIIYIKYCRRNFTITKVVYVVDKDLFTKMKSFVGWNVFGGLSNVLYGQGLNILLNLFFGPTVNAARGIAVQVQSIMMQISTNLQTAINPQITKQYAMGDLRTMHNLVYCSSRYTFFLLLIFCLPIFLEAKFLLSLWLTETPEWTVIFIKILLLIVIVDSVANPLMISSAATGNVKSYQTIIGGTMLLIVPVAYVFLKGGSNPSVVYLVHLTFCLITFVLRLLIIRPMIHLSIKDYFKKALWPCMKSGTIAIIPSVFLYWAIKESIQSSCIVIFCSFMCTSLSIALLGLTKKEKNLLVKKIKSLI